MWTISVGQLLSGLRWPHAEEFIYLSESVSLPCFAFFFILGEESKAEVSCLLWHVRCHFSNILLSRFPAYQTVSSRTVFNFLLSDLRQIKGYLSWSQETHYEDKMCY